MNTRFKATSAFWQSSQDEILQGLKEFLSIKSISAQAEHRSDVLAAADFVADELRRMGMDEVKVVQGLSDEQPLVTASWLHLKDAPTLLLYAHFDVQPVDPLELWQTPPFQPEVRDGKIFARGSADDKGQLFILLKVLEGYLKTSGSLPLNIKVLFEGEEESSGKHIERYLREHASELAADAALVLDSGMFAAGLPTISTALRGIVCAKLSCFGASSDLHSGEHGGAAPNAIQGLSEILTALKTASGRVRIPGFYEGILSPAEKEKAAWAKLQFSEYEYQAELGAAGLIGDRRYSVLHRRWALPTLEINGISGGYVGDGFKTVIPAAASAHLSLRLVPGMDPQQVAAKLEHYIKKVTPAQFRSEVTILSASPAMLVDIDSPYISACETAFRQVFQTDTVYVREGGSIPVAADMQSMLGVPVLITGFTLPDCKMHAPNENMDLANFYAGIQAVGAYFDILGRQKS